LRNLGTVLVAGALLVGLAACGDDDDDDAGGATTSAASGGGAAFTPIKADTLTVVTSLPGPGFWNGDDPAAITGGYEYEIVKAMQEKLGLANLDVQNVSFDQLVAGQVGDFDIAFSQVTITDERKQVVDFSDSYFESDQGVLVMEGTDVPDVAAAKELQWGVQSGTTGETFVLETLQPSSDPQVFQDLAAGFAALSAGQVDAFMMDTAIVLAQASGSGGEQVVAAQFKTGEQYGAILPKGSTNVARFNELIAELKSDGSLGRFAEEYLGGDPSKVPVLTV
jgi:polar amino acid transport system substrate-binding protein